ncbi:MAG TPA: amino acid adenylation domain-containing protein, partial [Ktedonobacteraceae bacterium]
DLTFALQERESGLSGVIGYRTDLFTEAAIVQLIQHFQVLLEHMVVSPEKPVAHLPLLSDQQQQQLLATWGAWQDGSGQERSVHGLFEEQVARVPDAIALTFAENQISYVYLNTICNRLAASLQTASQRLFQPVALLLTRGPAQIIALLAILKAGHTFVCLDPAAPPTRLQTVLNEISPLCLLTDASCVSRYQELLAQFRQEHDECALFLLDGSGDSNEYFVPIGENIDANSFSGQDLPSQTDNVHLDLALDAPAYITYTSGSTGTPKGIVQSHRNFSSFLRWFRAFFDLRPSRRVAQWASLTFDPALAEIFATLCAGATLCLSSEVTMGDPQAVLAWLHEEQITLLQTVPSFLRYLLPADASAPPPFPCLEQLLLTGEVFAAELAHLTSQAARTQPALFNLYGPSETILATCQPLAALEQLCSPLPVGYPLPGCQVLLLDAEDQLCPVGVAGEICLSGLFLSAGYFQQAAETARRFRPHPFAERPGQRLYHTGDQGRWRADGSLEFLGRRDQQVKIRGM